MTASEPRDVTSTGTPTDAAGSFVRVVGVRPVLEVCGRVALILLVAAVLLYVTYLVVERPTAGDAVDAGAAAAILAMMYGLHLVAVLVLGLPGGLLTAHLLRHESSEARHVAAFALTGAALGAAVLLVLGQAGPAAVWSVVGGLTAGGARAWTGRSRRRRAVHPAGPYLP
ncbi:hypothetical protein Cfla_1215 [Cellulomonas flavigena DSM 20109]|uniref:Uncharacterized protein n=1 Tax=Cellulomonas flavigena (strain ATCC 482 / DSM 20109 / BCRC 11376 / JCM 18109 / NBRC 3775 / NCIMB 8073 / NRS 134) TaxID=446466 RepID=D5UBM2_CELFN|nr:hypothetical protein [Cellulomonas flavigena]ADG74117.1 hypothetical protein Cfla_1215 [Cellulomonas flavigena DSM 20109]